MRSACAALLALACSAIAVPTNGNYENGNHGHGNYGIDHHGSGNYGNGNNGNGNNGNGNNGNGNNGNGNNGNSSNGSGSNGGGSSGGAAPTANVKNGTYTGVYSAEYDQDFFLGVPYAQPPVGDLRFRIPHSLNSAWSGSHDAMQYSAECVGYGSDQWNYPVSEVSLLHLVCTNMRLTVGVRTACTSTLYVRRASTTPRHSL